METVRIILQPEGFLLAVRQLRDVKNIQILWNLSKSVGSKQLSATDDATTNDVVREWGVDAILLRSNTDRFPELERYVGNVPVIELVNMIHDASVATRVCLS